MESSDDEVWPYPEKLRPDSSLKRLRTLLLTLERRIAFVGTPHTASKAPTILEPTFTKTPAEMDLAVTLPSGILWWTAFPLDVSEIKCEATIKQRTLTTKRMTIKFKEFWEKLMMKKFKTSKKSGPTAAEIFTFFLRLFEIEPLDGYSNDEWKNIIDTFRTIQGSSKDKRYTRGLEFEDTSSVHVLVKCLLFESEIPRTLEKFCEVAAEESVLQFWRAFQTIKWNQDELYERAERNLVDFTRGTVSPVCRSILSPILLVSNPGHAREGSSFKYFLPFSYDARSRYFSFRAMYFVCEQYGPSLDNPRTSTAIEWASRSLQRAKCRLVDVVKELGRVVLYLEKCPKDEVFSRILGTFVGKDGISFDEYLDLVVDDEAFKFISSDLRKKMIDGIPLDDGYSLLDGVSTLFNRCKPLDLSNFNDLLLALFEQKDFSVRDVRQIIGRFKGMRRWVFEHMEIILKKIQLPQGRLNVLVHLEFFSVLISCDEESTTNWLKKFSDHPFFSGSSCARLREYTQPEPWDLLAKNTCPRGFEHTLWNFVVEDCMKAYIECIQHHDHVCIPPFNEASGISTFEAACWTRRLEEDGVPQENWGKNEIREGAVMEFVQWLNNSPHRDHRGGLRIITNITELQGQIEMLYRSIVDKSCTIGEARWFVDHFEMCEALLRGKVHLEPFSDHMVETMNTFSSRENPLLVFVNAFATTVSIPKELDPRELDDDSPIRHVEPLAHFYGGKLKDLKWLASMQKSIIFRTEILEPLISEERQRQTGSDVAAGRGEEEGEEEQEAVLLDMEKFFSKCLPSLQDSVFVLKNHPQLRHPLHPVRLFQPYAHDKHTFLLEWKILVNEETAKESTADAFRICMLIMPKAKDFLVFADAMSCPFPETEKSFVLSFCDSVNSCSRYETYPKLLNRMSRVFENLPAEHLRAVISLGASFAVKGPEEEIPKGILLLDWLRKQSNESDFHQLYEASIEGVLAHHYDTLAVIRDSFGKILYDQKRHSFSHLIQGVLQCLGNSGGKKAEKEFAPPGDTISVTPDDIQSLSELLPSIEAFKENLEDSPLNRCRKLVKSIKIFTIQFSPLKMFEDMLIFGGEDGNKIDVLFSDIVDVYAVFQTNIRRIASDNDEESKKLTKELEEFIAYYEELKSVRRRVDHMVTTSNFKLSEEVSCDVRWLDIVTLKEYNDRLEAIEHEWDAIVQSLRGKDFKNLLLFSLVEISHLLSALKKDDDFSLFSAGQILSKFFVCRDWNTELRTWQENIAEQDIDRVGEMRVIEDLLNGLQKISPRKLTVKREGESDIGRKATNLQNEVSVGRESSTRGFLAIAPNDSHVFGFGIAIYSLICECAPLPSRVLFCTKRTIEDDIVRFMNIRERQSDLALPQHHFNHPFLLLHPERLSKEALDRLSVFTQTGENERRAPLIAICSEQSHRADIIRTRVGLKSLEVSFDTPFLKILFSVLSKDSLFSTSIKRFTSAVPGSGKTTELLQWGLKMDSTWYVNIPVMGDMQISMDALNELYRAPHDKGVVHFDITYATKGDAFCKSLWELLFYGWMSSETSSVVWNWNRDRHFVGLEVFSRFSAKESTEYMWDTIPIIHLVPAKECYASAETFSFDEFNFQPEPMINIWKNTGNIIIETPDNPGADVRNVLTIFPYPRRMVSRSRHVASLYLHWATKDENFQSIYDAAYGDGGDESTRLDNVAAFEALTSVLEERSRKPLSWRLVEYVSNFFSFYALILKEWPWINPQLSDSSDERDIVSDEFRIFHFMPSFHKLLIAAGRDCVSRNLDIQKKDVSMKGKDELDFVENLLSSLASWESHGRHILFAKIDQTKAEFDGINIFLQTDENGYYPPFPIHKDFLPHIEENGLKPNQISAEIFLKENANIFDRTALERGYEVTNDNLTKMIFILYRLRCGLPVVLMGETGCGKTALIRNMCRMMHIENYFRSVYIHGGTQPEDILRMINEAERDAMTISQLAPDDKIKERFVTVFFDEFNAGSKECIALVEKILLERRVCGRPIHPLIRLLGAMNPYRKRNKEEWKRPYSERGGLDFQYETPEKEEMAQMLQKAVYRVNDIPHSVFDCIYDFGELAPDQSLAYIQRMVSSCVDSGMATGVVKTIVSIHNVISNDFVADKADACTLRHVARFLKLYTWFMTSTTGKFFCGDHMTSVNLALFIAYFVSLSAENRHKLGESGFTYFMKYVQGSAERASKALWRNLIEKTANLSFVAPNQTLLENIFTSFVCILNNIPLFIVGPPGTSKSLSVELLISSLEQPNSFRKKYSVKSFQQSYFQCDPRSTSRGLESVFRKARRSLRFKHALPVVTLDEIGLAELSPDLPLKVVHRELELMDGGTVEDEKKMGVLAISNWRVDAAKLNRGVLLVREMMPEKEMIETAKSIAKSYMSTGLFTKIWKNMTGALTPERIIERLAKVCHDILIHQDESRPYFMLRDFYFAIKCLVRSWNEKKTVGNSQQIWEILCRNFGSKPRDDFMRMRESFMYHFCLRKDRRYPIIPATQLIDMNLAESRTADLDNGLENVFPSRHMMILSASTSSLHVMKDIASRPVEGEKQAKPPVIIFGSTFAEDLHSENVSRNLRRISAALSEGDRIILVNAKQLFEPLYFVLNLNIQCRSGKTFCRIAFGDDSPLSPISLKSRIFILINSEHAYHDVSPAILNRMEKHLIAPRELLTEGKDASLLNAMEKFASSIVRKCNPVPEADVFIGFHSDLIPSLAFKYREVEEDDDERWKHELRSIVHPWLVARDCRHAAHVHDRDHQPLWTMKELIDRWPVSEILMTCYTFSSSLFAFEPEDQENGHVLHVDEFRSSDEAQTSIDEIVGKNINNENFVLVLSFGPQKTQEIVDHVRYMTESSYQRYDRENAKMRTILLVQIPCSREKRSLRINFEKNWFTCVLDEVSQKPLPIDKLLTMESRDLWNVISQLEHGNDMLNHSFVLACMRTKAKIMTKESHLLRGEAIMSILRDRDRSVMRRLETYCRSLAGTETSHAPHSSLAELVNSGKLDVHESVHSFCMRQMKDAVTRNLLSAIEHFGGEMNLLHSVHRRRDFQNAFTRINEELDRMPELRMADAGHNFPFSRILYCIIKEEKLAEKTLLDPNKHVIGKTMAEQFCADVLEIELSFAEQVLLNEAKFNLAHILTNELGAAGVTQEWATNIFKHIEKRRQDIKNCAKLLAFARDAMQIPIPNVGRRHVLSVEETIDRILTLMTDPRCRVSPKDFAPLFVDIVGSATKRKSNFDRILNRVVALHVLYLVERIIMINYGRNEEIARTYLSDLATKIHINVDDSRCIQRDMFLHLLQELKDFTERRFYPNGRCEIDDMMDSSAEAGCLRECRSCECVSFAQGDGTAVVVCPFCRRVTQQMSAERTMDHVSLSSRYASLIEEIVHTFCSEWNLHISPDAVSSAWNYLKAEVHSKSCVKSIMTSLLGHVGEEEIDDAVDDVMKHMSPREIVTDGSVDAGVCEMIVRVHELRLREHVAKHDDVRLREKLVYDAFESFRHHEGNLTEMIRTVGLEGESGPNLLALLHVSTERFPLDILSSYAILPDESVDEALVELILRQFEAQNGLAETLGLLPKLPRKIQISTYGRFLTARCNALGVKYDPVAAKEAIGELDGHGNPRLVDPRLTVVGDAWRSIGNDANIHRLALHILHIACETRAEPFHTMMQGAFFNVPGFPGAGDLKTIQFPGSLSSLQATGLVRDTGRQADTFERWYICTCGHFCYLGIGCQHVTMDSMCDNCGKCLARAYNNPRDGVRKATTEDFQRISSGFQISHMEDIGGGSPFDWVKADALRVLRLFTMILLRTLAACPVYAHRGIPAYCKFDTTVDVDGLRRGLDALIAGDLNGLGALLSCDRDDVFRFLHLAMNEFVGGGMDFARDFSLLARYEGKTTWERSFGTLLDRKREEILRSVANAKQETQEVADQRQFICPEWMITPHKAMMLPNLLGRHTAAFNSGNLRASETCLKNIETLDHMRDAEGALLFYALVNSTLLGKITFEQSHTLTMRTFVHDAQMELKEVNLQNLVNMFKKTWAFFFPKVENLLECQRGEILRTNLAQVDEDKWCIAMLFVGQESEQKAVRAVMDAIIEWHNNLFEQMTANSPFRQITFGDIISARSDFLVSCSLKEVEEFCNRHSLFSAPLDNMFLLEDFVACRVIHNRSIIVPVFEDFVFEGELNQSNQLRLHYDGKLYWKPMESKKIAHREKSLIVDHLRTRGAIPESMEMLTQVLQFTMRLSRMFIEESNLPDFPIIQYVNSNFRGPFEHMIQIWKTMHPSLQEKAVLGNAHEILVQMTLEIRIGEEYNVQIPIENIDLVRGGLREVGIHDLENVVESLEEATPELSNFQVADPLVNIFDIYGFDLPDRARRVMEDRHLMVANFVPFLKLARDAVNGK